MKLVHPDIQMQIQIKLGTIAEMILENPNLFAACLSELYRQTQGEEGRFILSEDSNILKPGTYAECIINPYDLNVNKKKILTRVYAAIKNEVQDTDLYLEYEELLRNLHQFAEKVTEHMDIPLEYDSVSDAGILLKLLNFNIASEDTPQMVERLIDYIKILSEYTEIKLIILVNIKSYISCENMKHLQKICAYLKMALLLVENTEGYRIDGSLKYIIDSDGCEIYT